MQIARVTSSKQECGEVDGLWTSDFHIPISVVTADCIPILLYRKDRQAVAALHSGWKGTLTRIPEAFFKSLPAELQRPSDWCGIIGPSIRACCYEVSEELIQNFISGFPELSPALIQPSHRKLDLTAITSRVLQSLGVEISLIHPECTLCTKENGTLKYHSYRGGDRSSRQYSVIQIKK